MARGDRHPAPRASLRPHMSSLTEQFCTEHFTLESISPARQGSVRYALASFESFLGGDASTGTDNDLRLWMASLLDGGNAPSTVATRLKAVKPFYRWLWLRRDLDPDAWMRVQAVKPPRGFDSKAPRPYSRKEVAKLWTTIERMHPWTTEMVLKRWQNGTSPYLGNVRHHMMRAQLEVMIELALICGLRRSEIYNLTVNDAHQDNAYLVVRGKRVDQNEKVREVPYPDSTRESMLRWFRLRAFMSPKGGMRLWLSITGPEPASELNDARMANILPGDYTLHRLRHTCATERLRAGMELEKLQRFLGHSDIAMTLRYAKLVGGDIHKAAEKQDYDLQRAIGRRKAA
jgi:integrase